MPQLDTSMFGGPKTEKKRSTLDTSMFGGRAPDVEQEEEPGLLAKAGALVPQPVKTTVGTVLELLGRPSGALAGAALAQREGRSRWDAAKDNLAGRRHDSFMDVAKKDFGEDSAIAKPIGFAADVVADPLNLVGLGEIRAASKALGVTGAAGKIGETVAKHTPDVIKDVGTAVKDELGQMFVPRYGMTLTPEDIAELAKQGKTVTPDMARDSMRFFQKERSTIPTRVEQDIISSYKGTTPGFRKDVALALDEGAPSMGGKTLAQAQAIDAAAQAQRTKNADLFKREVDAGLQKPQNEIADYAPYDFSRTKGAQRKAHLARNHPNAVVNAKLGHARPRHFDSLKEAVAAGAEPDIALSQLTRNIKGETAVASANFLKDMGKKVGMDAKSAPAHWHFLKNVPMESGLAKEMSAIKFPAYIAKHLETVFEGKREAGIIGKAYDSALKLWRTQATVLRPGFHATNLQGNLFNGAVLAGALHPARYLEAATWERIKAKAANATRQTLQGASGSTTVTQGMPPNIGKYTVQEVDDFMQKYAVGGAGHNFTNELMESGADKVLMEKLAGKTGSHNPLKHPLRAARAAGSALEDFSKRALFFDALHKGANLEDAAKQVDKYLFDYADLTPFEKNYMRRIMPFYTWARKNIPLQAESVVNQPGKFAAVEKTRRTIERESAEEGTRTPDGERVKYLQEQNAIQLPTEKGQDKKFWTPYLPYQDLNKIPIPGGSDPLEAARDLASGLEPISKSALELITNKSLFMNKPLFDEELGPVGDRQKINPSMDLLPDALKRVLFTETRNKKGQNQFETPAIVKYGAQNALPLVESAGKGVQSITRPEDSPNPYSWAGQLFGVRVTPRTAQQEALDRKAARSGAKRINTKNRNQNRKPAAQKAQVDALWSRYSQEP